MNVLYNMPKIVRRGKEKASIGVPRMFINLSLSLSPPPLKENDYKGGLQVLKY